jgi:transglutaminase/protease-like cytokinesis protein 3
MKKSFGLFIFVIILAFLFVNVQKISLFVSKNYLTKTIVVPNSGLYKRDYQFIQDYETDDYNPKSITELKNIFFTILNNGWENFSFYCHVEYKECQSDLIKITQNSSTLSLINNFVSPYHSFNEVSVTTNAFNKITVNVTYLYNETIIDLINNQMDNIIKDKIKDNMNSRDKIKVIHDYIINNTVYDVVRAEEIRRNMPSNPSNKSNMAYGPLIQGKGICGGYTDAMSLFLDRFDIPNFKVSTIDHIWNYVYLDGKWYHLDLTWDDPVTSSGRNILLHKFFLIDDATLKNINTGQHNYGILYFN